MSSQRKNIEPRQEVIIPTGISAGDQRRRAAVSQITRKAPPKSAQATVSSRCALPVMRRQCHGRIVNLSSVAGAIPIPFQTYYSASKAAINS